MDQYREFVFNKLASGRLNDIQVDYLMNCMDANGDILSCLDDLNLKAEFQTFKSQQLTYHQEVDFQTSLLTDKIKSCQEEIDQLNKELAVLSPKLNALLHDSNTLDARYKNFPENPTYVVERDKLVKQMNTIQASMNPLETKVETLKSELESLQVAAN